LPEHSPTAPDLVVADEPTANLDHKTAMEVIDLMKTLNNELGVTFVFSTHDPKIMAAASRVITSRRRKDHLMIEWRLAFRNLVRNQRRTLISVLMIAAGFCAMVLFQGFSSFVLGGA
jgi:ABC-type lipoprotein export system ATPase subunit